MVKTAIENLRIPGYAVPECRRIVCESVPMHPDRKGVSSQHFLQGIIGQDGKENVHFYNMYRNNG